MLFLDSIIFVTLTSLKDVSEKLYYLLFTTGEKESIYRDSEREREITKVRTIAVISNSSAAIKSVIVV